MSRDRDVGPVTRLLLEVVNLEGEALERRLERESESVRDEVRRLLADDRPAAGDPIGRLLREPALLMTPEVVASASDFEVLAWIGSGAHGDVYVATQRQPTRRVAIKFLRGGRLTKRALDRLEREIATLGALEHPGVVRIYEASTSEEVPFIVTEYIDGHHLREWSADVALSRKLDVLEEVMAAVDYVHRRGVLHLDLKPDNILVDRAGHPHVIDFGLARALADMESEGARGSTGGTFPYVAPEILATRGRERSVSADVYSLGVITAEVLVGRIAFATTPSSSTDRPGAMSAGTDPFDRAALSALPRPLARIIEKAMAAEPAMRYPTVSSMLEDLRRYRSMRPITAAPPRMHERIVLACRRRPGWFLATVTIAAVSLWAGANELRMRAAERRVTVEQTKFLGMIGRSLQSAETRGFSGAAIAGVFDGVIDEFTAEVGDPTDRETSLLLAVLRSDRAARRPASDPAARAELERVVSVLGELARDREAHDPASLELALAWVRIGDKTGDDAEKQRVYERAHRIYLAAVTGAPDHPTAYGSLGSSYERLAFLRVHRGEYKEAEELALSRLAIAVRMAERFPEHPIVAHDEFLAHQLIATIERSTNRDPRARDRAAAAAAERALRASPRKLTYRIDALRARLDEASDANRFGEPSRAVALFEDVWLLARRIAQEYPWDPDQQTHTHHIAIGIREALANAGREGEALEFVDGALEDFENARRLGSGIADPLDLLFTRVQVLRARGDDVAAEEGARRLELRLVEASREDASGESEYQLSRVYRGLLRDLEAALPSAERAVEKDGGRNVDYLQQLGEIASALGRDTTAIDAFERLLRILPENAREYRETLESSLERLRTRLK